MEPFAKVTAYEVNRFGLGEDQLNQLEAFFLKIHNVLRLCKLHICFTRGEPRDGEIFRNKLLDLTVNLKFKAFQCTHSGSRA